MKIKENYLHEALRAEKNDKPEAGNNVRRNAPPEQSAETANKFRPADSTVKDEMKFANLLESPAKVQKPGQHRDESGDERRDDQKKESAKRETREKDNADKATKDGATEKYESAGGQTGGQGGFGTGGSAAGNLNLNENFAARSILHIADLERLVSTVRTQIGLGGKREVILQLKHSVLEGLQIKISTAPDAKVQIEFLAADPNTRRQIEKHAAELANILRGRGINLETLKTTVDSNASGDGSGSRGSESDKKPRLIEENKPVAIADAADADENTFGSPDAADGKIYNA